jgi:hypothetical protein
MYLLVDGVEASGGRGGVVANEAASSVADLLKLSLVSQVSYMMVGHGQKV